MGVKLCTGSLSRLSLPIARWAPHDLLRVAVEPHEEAEYREAHPTVDFFALPESGRGFSYMLNHLLLDTEARGDDWFVFCDDDVTGLRARSSLDEKEHKVEPDEVADILDWLVAAGVEDRAATVAAQMAATSWGASKPITTPMGGWGMLAIKVSRARSIGGWDESIPIFADWDFAARLFLSRQRGIRLNLVAFVHTMNATDGGASEIYSDPAGVEDAARAVARRYPGATRIVAKKGLVQPRFNWRRLASMGETRRGRHLPESSTILETARA